MPLYPATIPENANWLTVGEEVFSRELAGSSTVSMVSQALRLTYFTARKTETTTQVRMISGTTPAGATPTLCRLGLYLIDSSDVGALVASTPNDLTLFSVASTVYTRSWTAPYGKVSGLRYALGILVVSAFAMPTIAGYGTATSMDAETAISPRTSGRVSGQADLPSLFVSGSLVTTINHYYGVILP